MTEQSAEEIVAEKLRKLAPAADCSRIWGRMDAAEFERVHGIRPTEDGRVEGASAGNAWAADPEDIAELVVAALRSAGLLLPEGAGTEYCPEGHDPDGDLAQHHRVVGPWVPVGEDTAK